MVKKTATCRGVDKRSAIHQSNRSISFVEDYANANPPYESMADQKIQEKGKTVTQSPS